jgi:hypothetical protein
MDRVVKSLCTLLGEDEGVVYTWIIVATGKGDTTTPVLYEDHSSNRQMR